MKRLFFVFVMIMVALAEVNAEDLSTTRNVTFTGEVAKRIFHYIENADPGLSRNSDPSINRFGNITCRTEENGNHYVCVFRISTNMFKSSYDPRRKVERRKIYGTVAQKSFFELFEKNFGIDPDLRKDIDGKCEKFSNCITQYSIPEGMMNCKQRRTSFGPGFAQIFYTCALDEKFVEISE